MNNWRRPFFSIPYFSKLYAIWWMAWTVWPNTAWLLSTTTMISGHGVVVANIEIMVLGSLLHGIQVFHLIFSWRWPRSIELLGTCTWMQHRQVVRYFDNSSLHLWPWQYGMWIFVLWHPPFCTFGHDFHLCYTQNSQQVEIVTLATRILESTKLYSKLWQALCQNLELCHED